MTQRASYGLGKGLLLAADSDGLVDLPGTENEERIAVEETYRVQAFAEAPTLEVRTTYYGELGEMLRQAVALQPAETLEQNLSQELFRTHPGLEKTAPMKTEDVPGQDAFRIVQYFKAPKFWRFSDDKKKLVTDYVLWNLAAPLTNPGSATRSQPFQIGYPGIYRHVVQIEFPEDVVNASGNKRTNKEDRHLSMQVNLDVAPRQYRMQGELRLLKDRVEVSEWPDYMEFLRKLDRELSGTFNVPLLSPAQTEQLRPKLKELAESWQGPFARKPPTSVQADAMIDKLMLTAFLDAGRLPPELRAETLRRRGIALDNLGLPQQAKADFDEALKLAPNVPENLEDAAVNAFQLGQDATAAEYANKALSLNPASTTARGTLAFLAYYEKNYAEAKRHLLERLKRREQVDEGYATIWLFLTTRRNNEDAMAAVKPYMPSDKTAWPQPILQYLMGSSTWEQALNIARENPKDPSRLCELYFYAGEKALIEGRTPEARELFNKSLDTGVVEFDEYQMSKRSLKQLAETAKP